MRSAIRVLVIAFGVAMLLGVPATAGAVSRTQQESDSASSKKGGDVDTVVSHPVEKVRDAVRLALATYGCDIKKDESDLIECTRSRRMGIAVGSGGEKITVQLMAQEVATRLVIKTGKGFVGRLGKKNWSTPVYDETIKVLEGK
jgi:hypothetical protein